MDTSLARHLRKIKTSYPTHAWMLGILAIRVVARSAFNRQGFSVADDSDAAPLDRVTTGIHAM
jgi:hypothetical protein